MYKRYLAKLTRTRLDDVLIDEGFLPRASIEDAQAEADMTGRQLSDVLFERQEIDEWDLAKVVARAYSLPFVDVVAYNIPREAEELLDTEFCVRNMVLPFDSFGGIPALAACEVPTQAVLDEIEARCGHAPFVYVTLRGRMVQALEARGANVRAPVAAPAAKGATPAEQPAPSVSEPAPAAGGPRASELEPASMRLSFNMHRRGARPAEPLPEPPVPVSTAVKTPPPAAPRAQPKPRPAESPEPEPEAASEAGAGAAWQSIFDLGDDAVG